MNVNTSETHFTHFRCRACRAISPIADLIDQPWFGWNAAGIQRAQNLCCPDCGSNDIIFRAPESDDGVRKINVFRHAGFVGVAT